MLLNVQVSDHTHQTTPTITIKKSTKKTCYYYYYYYFIILFLFFFNFIIINTDHISFRSFHQWVESSVAEGVELDPEFIAGVQLGIGCFNLVIFYYFFNPKF